MVENGRNGSRNSKALKYTKIRMPSQSIIGAMKSCPTNSMEVILGIQPINFKVKTDSKLVFLRLGSSHIHMEKSFQGHLSSLDKRVKILSAGIILDTASIEPSKLNSGLNSSGRMKPLTDVGIPYQSVLTDKRPPVYSSLDYMVQGLSFSTL